MNNEITVFVRLLNLTRFQGLVLTKEIEGSTFKPETEPNQYIGYIPLTDDNMHEILNFIERQKIDLENGEADILISVISERNSDSFDAPMTVNALLKLCNLKLTFSFSYMPE